MRITGGEELLGMVDAFVFDCDGVIWRGDHMIERFVDVLHKPTPTYYTCTLCAYLFLVLPFPFPPTCSADAMLEMLVKLNKTVVFVTNNSTKTLANFQSTLSTSDISPPNPLRFLTRGHWWDAPTTLLRGVGALRQCPGVGSKLYLPHNADLRIAGDSSQS